MQATYLFCIIQEAPMIFIVSQKALLCQQKYLFTKIISQAHLSMLNSAIPTNTIPSPEKPLNIAYIFS